MNNISQRTIFDVGKYAHTNVPQTNVRYIHELFAMANNATRTRKRAHIDSTIAGTPARKLNTTTRESPSRVHRYRRVECVQTYVFTWMLPSCDGIYFGI